MPDPNDMPGRSKSGAALKVFFTLGALALVGTCAAILSPAGQDFMNSMRDFSEAIEEGADSPGMAELRAIGCDYAISVPVEDMAEFTSSLSAKFEVEKTLADVPSGTRWVQCKVELPAFDVPSCELIARTLGDATSIQEPFIVVSGKPGTTVCSGYYSSDGSRLGALDEKTLGMKSD